jgi:hypothetical protein
MSVLLRPILPSFNGGEISPRMGGRVDTAIYQVAVETCENFVPTVEGPVVKRPGFEYIEPADESATWLSTFRFSLTQDYVLVWGDNQLQFFTHGFRIESPPGTPVTVATPYSGAEAPLVSAQQSYDRQYLDHPAHAPGRLTRTGAATFVYDTPAFVNGPFADENSDQTITVEASGTAVGASVTLTASSPIFQAGHVGGLFRIEALDFAAITSWQVGIDGINVGDLRRNEGNVYKALTAGRTGTVAPIHTSGTAWDGSPGNDVNGKGPYGIQWQFQFDKFGILLITGFTDTSHVTATVQRTLPNSLTATPSWRWAHGLFSNAAGWPDIVAAWKGRLCHWKGFDLCASVSGDYLNHATFDTVTDMTETDLAFRQTITTEDPPLWAAADSAKMILGTASRQLAVGAIGSVRRNMTSTPIAMSRATPRSGRATSPRAGSSSSSGRRIRRI